MVWRFGAILLVLGVLIPKASAQNVTGYGMMPDPFLFLLREPAVHADLELSASQEQQLIHVNESFDGVLLASRNTTPEEAQAKTNEVMTKTRDAVEKLFTAEQKIRLRQITYRLRGLSFVLIPQAAEELGLSSEQRDTIQSVVSTTLEEVNGAQSKTYQGAEAYQKSQRTIAAARKREQEEILAALDDSQKRKLLELVGKRFDASSLGRVSFKAPDLADGDKWLNSDALKLKDLRGKVVALHFWAFG